MARLSTLPDATAAQLTANADVCSICYMDMTPTADQVILQKEQKTWDKKIISFLIARPPPDSRSSSSTPV